MEIKELENKIINADCMDILRQLPDKCIDLVLTDPPYGSEINGVKIEREIELEKQLDREIKINRKMKSALEKYAYEGNWDCLFDNKVYGKAPNTNWNADGNGYDLAQQVLKEIDNKE
ncbi:MAG: hypothetical protein SOZ42_01135 [Candidatus Enterosoma sp.]|nr:hypothetical protein [Candidatus Enterosoma sp.]